MAAGLQTQVTNSNSPFWSGPHAAGMDKATIPSDVGLATTGENITVFVGRNCAGGSRTNIGANAAGQPKAVTHPVALP